MERNISAGQTGNPRHIAILIRECHRAERNRQTNNDEFWQSNGKLWVSSETTNLCGVGICKYLTQSYLVVPVVGLEPTRLFTGPGF